MINVADTKLDYFELFKQKHKAKRYQKDCDNFELRDKIRDNLLYKQRNQCAYCERKISKIDSHIEHIRQRDKFPKLECEYSNLILSCNNENSCGKYKDSKKNSIRYWQDKFIHPILDNPKEYFRFNEDGQILSTDKPAKETIKYLNLNNQKLIRIRKSLILQMVYMQDMDNISDYFDEFENLIMEFS